MKKRKSGKNQKTKTGSLLGILLLLLFISVFADRQPDAGQNNDTTVEQTQEKPDGSNRLQGNPSVKSSEEETDDSLDKSEGRRSDEQSAADNQPSAQETPETASQSEQSGTTAENDEQAGTSAEKTAPDGYTSFTFNIDDIPEYSGTPVYTLNSNQPLFGYEDLTTESFEFYSDLDSLGRCGVCYACIGTDLFPTEERGSISSVKPTGWVISKYDCVDGKYLYNRCHLLGFQLTGENANKKNLITGTRYLNVQGMLPYENMVHDYVEDTGNHVLYRVTPIFVGDELVARGVTMEAFSVEDEGEELCFYVFVYNVQPGVAIRYDDGDNCEDDSTLQYAP